MSRSQATIKAGYDPWERIKQVDEVFQGTHPVHVTMRRLAEELEKAHIPYAIMGAMAVNLHGAERTTKDVDILLTSEGLDLFRKDFVGRTFDQEIGRSRRFIDRANG